MYTISFPCHSQRSEESRIHPHACFNTYKLRKTTQIYVILPRQNYVELRSTPQILFFVLKYFCISHLVCLHLQKHKKKDMYINKYQILGWIDTPVLTNLNRGG